MARWNVCLSSFRITSGNRLIETRRTTMEVSIIAELVGTVVCARCTHCTESRRTPTVFVWAKHTLAQHTRKMAALNGYRTVHESIWRAPESPWAVCPCATRHYASLISEGKRLPRLRTAHTRAPVRALSLVFMSSTGMPANESEKSSRRWRTARH